MLLGASLLFTGCSHQANITLLRDCPLEARIISSDRDFIYVEREFSTEPAAIPRKEVIEIDHPGNGMAVTGIVILGLYGAEAIAGASLLTSKDEVSRATGAVLLTVGGVGSTIGALLTAWGYSIWSDSVDAAALPSKPSSQLVPWFGVGDNGRMVRGLGFRWTY